MPTHDRYRGPAATTGNRHYPRSRRNRPLVGVVAGPGEAITHVPPYVLDKVFRGNGQVPR